MPRPFPPFCYPAGVATLPRSSEEAADEKEGPERDAAGAEEEGPSENEAPKSKSLEASVGVVVRDQEPISQKAVGHEAPLLQSAHQHC